MTDYDPDVYAHARALARLDPAAVLAGLAAACPWWLPQASAMFRQSALFRQDAAAPLTINRVDGLTINLSGGRRAMTVQRDAAGAIVGATAEEVMQ